MSKHVSNPFRAGQWFTEVAPQQDEDVVVYVSNPFRAGQWFTVLLLVSCAGYSACFKPLQSGAMVHWPELVRSDLLIVSFKPLQSGAMVHCLAAGYPEGDGVHVSNPFRAGQWFTGLRTTDEIFYLTMTRYSSTTNAHHGGRHVWFWPKSPNRAAYLLV